MNAADSIRDDLLVLRCQAGESHAFDQLVERWQLPLVRYIYRLTGNWTLAQDLAQETWLVVIQSLVGLREVARFKSWLFRIASHKCADHWRRSRRTHELSQRLGEEFPDTPSPSETARQEEIALAFVLLSPQSRTVLALHYLEGFAVDEIAEILSLPAGTVKSRLFHARKQLRTQMEKNDGTDRT